MLNGVEDRLGDLGLGGARDVLLTRGGEDRDLIALRADPDVRAGDVVDDDHVQPLLLELAAPVFNRATAVLGGKPYERLPRAPPCRQRLEYIRGRLELQAQMLATG